MNETKLSVPIRRHPGRLYLFLGLLVAASGIAIYTIQIRAKVLAAPWYVPILATAGLLLVMLALAQSRTIWRWLAAGAVTLLAAGEWLMMLVLMAAPAYTGSVEVGRAFPNFDTTLAGGGNFSQADLQGDKDTVLLFFRGRW